VVSVLHVWPAGQPPPHVWSQIHWPQVADTELLSHTEPLAHEPPPQLWSQTQICRAALQVKPEGQWPQVGGSHSPQVAVLGSVLQIWLFGQPPPQVVSQAHWPQVGDDVLVSHVAPAGQPPPQVVSQRHMPHVVETHCWVLLFQLQPLTAVHVELVVLS
jgi:hypothetical protein